MTAEVEIHFKENKRKWEKYEGAECLEVSDFITFWFAAMDKYIASEVKTPDLHMS